MLFHTFSRTVAVKFFKCWGMLENNENLEMFESSFHRAYFGYLLHVLQANNALFEKKNC